MDDIIDTLITHIKKNNIKFITISESNHRSYTCHTFQYKLVKKLYENNIIDTFSSERLGITDGEIINYYLKNNLDTTNIIEKLPFGGMGFYRVIKYFSKKPFKKYKIVGLEEDRYCKKIEPTLKKLKKYITTYHTDKDREDFWLENIIKIIKERGNLFINGFHLSKNDKIGKYLLKNHKKETLFLSMAAFKISTQILIIDEKEKDMDFAVYNKDYEKKIENISKICPPTKLEKNIKKNIEIIKVTKKNSNEKIRAVGCYLAVYKDEYNNKEDISNDITYKIKNYDYVILIKNSIYKEKMFY